jgi:hypothetical protein
MYAPGFKKKRDSQMPWRTTSLPTTIQEIMLYCIGELQIDHEAVEKAYIAILIIHLVLRTIFWPK